MMITLGADDVEIGKLLGTGGFAHVFSVTVKHRLEFDLQLQDKYDDDEEELTIQTAAETLEQSGPSLGSSLSSLDTTASFRNEQEEEQQQPQLAMKRLHSTTLKCPKTTQYAFQDMHTEVKLLSQLPCHPNIITLHGVSADFWTSPETAFFVLERLTESLDKTLGRWREEVAIGNNLLGRFNKKKVESQQSRRIQKVAVGTARALAFLHEHGIIFRDLKPQNVGLDEHGCIRLFDFGLAKKVAKEQQQLTGQVGTLRYMAPEVALSQPYSFSADVHSFGMFLWEVCALEKPFRKCRDWESLSFKVMQKGKNPSLSKISCQSIKELLLQCWAVPEKRPSFQAVLNQLNRAKKDV